jgi:tRNA A37 threonylcarbamoyltransferase TsaD
VLDCVIRSISKAVIPASEASGLATVLFVGGVASNSRVRSGLMDALGPRGMEALFGKATLSTDNAVGVAYLGELWR